MEKYSNKIWFSLKNKKLKSNLYLYELKKKGNLLKLGKKEKNINFFLKIKFNYYKIRK